ncbi:hypothetical protein HK102_007935, partial [Quaeritorhiza haematococci]
DDFRVGYTVVVMMAHQSTFEDYTTGIRVEEIEQIKVIPTTLPTLLHISAKLSHQNYTPAPSEPSSSPSERTLLSQIVDVLECVGVIPPSLAASNSELLSPFSSSMSQHLSSFEWGYCDSAIAIASTPVISYGQPLPSPPLPSNSASPLIQHRGLATMMTTEGWCYALQTQT